MDNNKTFFNWSTGKDAALALYFLMQDEEYSVDHLLTSVNSHFDRVSMHGLRRSLLEKQVNSLNIPFSTVELPQEPSMEDYSKLMGDEVGKLYDAGFRTAAFGDIFLEDLKEYRVKQLSKLNMDSCFPLWKRDTRELLEQFIDLGFKAVVVCTKAELLDESFVGRELDHDFLRDLPENVDPCGENGEFHTFCYDGPIFKSPIEFTIGEKTYREYNSPKKDDVHNNDSKMGFWYCDLY